MGPGELTVESSRLNGVCTVALAGELDLATVGAAEDGLEEAARTDAERIVLDLNRLGFMDSTGVTMLLRMRERLGAERLAVRRPRGSAERVLELTRVAEMLRFAD
jgi:anti-sigma B factor antagonist